MSHILTKKLLTSLSCSSFTFHKPWNKAKALFNFDKSSTRNGGTSKEPSYQLIAFLLIFHCIRLEHQKYKYIPNYTRLWKYFVCKKEPWWPGLELFARERKGEGIPDKKKEKDKEKGNGNGIIIVIIIIYIYIYCVWWRFDTTVLDYILPTYLDHSFYCILVDCIWNTINIVFWNLRLIDWFSNVLNSNVWLAL